MKSDVCLILEGTYPYVAGGVSTWVAQLLNYMPQLSFSILFIGARRELSMQLKYELPPNVVELNEVFLHDMPPPLDRSFKMTRHPELWEALEIFETAIVNGEPLDPLAVALAVKEIPGNREFMHMMLQSHAAWDRVVDLYNRTAPRNASFLDFFWTHRYINLPVLQLLRHPLPEARLYHAACTGYAGLLGALAHKQTSSPFVLTEHGIYTRERRIEIFNADWILAANADSFLDIPRLESFFKNWWTNFFKAMSVTAYQSSERITSLFEANCNAQIHEGAPPDRMQIIPNGIDTKRFMHLTPRSRTASDPLHIGFVGRVTSIKDVKTLLRALAILRARSVAFTLYIIGPIDEEPDYVEECNQLMATLNITDNIIYTGRVNVAEYFERIDLLILTSISEGQPFVILEAQCAGLPVIASDVGACKELLYGRTPQDQALGRSGIITAVATPDETAEALYFMSRFPAKAAEMGANGRKRALMFYDIRNVMHQYLELYENHLYARSRQL